ncbi:DUF6790 family protein [uncultured Acetobacterium sp.]|uniref:DUF6790 family protein n=1 Tax=uncultured Acetobacterium sp. TaxID=217139 RepID=UPI0025DB8205|nr:DUF6790 family protein [uncultured Acetobacterium sp.]
MIFMGLFLTGLVSGLIHWLIRRNNGALLAETLLLHQLFFLGVAMTISFMGHVLMSEEIAAQIGWVSNGFQKELGYVSLGIGICGFLAVKFRGAFWAPIIIISVVFFFGAALIHLRELLTLANFNPGNALIIIPDLLGPVTLVVLGLLTLREKRRSGAV